MLERMWRKRNSHPVCVRTQFSTTSMESLKKIKMEMPHNPSVPMVGICPKDLKTKRLCITMFIATLFTTNMLIDR